MQELIQDAQGRRIIVTPSHVPNHALRKEDVPTPSADWDVIGRFALTFDGYALWEDECEVIANRLRVNHEDGVALRAITLTELRTALFFEQRRFRFSGVEPLEEDRPYIDELVACIRDSVPTVESSPRPTDYLPPEWP